MNDTSMMAIAALAAPFEDGLPCGANLEYDPQFLALEEAASGKPEVQYGSTITPAAAPDWKMVRELALALSGRTRDLRIAVCLTRALLELEGVPGLAAGLSLLAEMLSGQWEAVHPQLDADDGGDPTLRLNTLAVLVDAGGMLRQVRDMPLAQARAVGAVSLRDIELASSEDPAAEGGAASRASIGAVFSATAPEQLAATHAALEQASAGVRHIDMVLTVHLDAGMGLDLAPLASLLHAAAAQLAPLLAPMDGTAPHAADAPGGAGPAAARGDGEIASRADVARLLDRLCSWYALHEPSSPVPLLLARAKGLVDKNFAELMLELAPDGLGQLSQVSGIRHES